MNTIDSSVSGSPLVVGGMVMLLGAWISQQILYEKWREQLSELAIKESTFNAYDSAHSFFELLLNIAPVHDREQILHASIAHYWKGLMILIEQLPSDLYKASYKEIWDPLPKQNNDVPVAALSAQWTANWQNSLRVDQAASRSYEYALKRLILEVKATKQTVINMRELIE
jgi:hypothetical protein